MENVTHLPVFPNSFQKFPELIAAENAGYANTQSTLVNLIIDGLKSDFQASESKGYLQQIKCLRCGERRAYTSKEKPFKIKCNRQNNCSGAEGVNYTEYLPDVRKGFYSKMSEPTPDDPHRLYRAYAQVRRGIKNYEQWGGEYQKQPIKNGDSSGHYHALAFRLSDGKTMNLRLIDCPARPTHNTGSVEKLLWIPSATIDLESPIYVAEAPLKAMGILESGRQAISVVSSTCSPDKKDWLNENKAKIGKLILAFDNDKAGRKALAKWSEFCEREGIDYHAEIPPYGKDWDDLHKEGLLEQDETWQKARLEGDLATAKTPVEAAEAWQSSQDQAPTVFEWKGSLWAPKYKKSEKEGSVTYTLESCKQVLNGTLSASYSIKTEPLDKEGEGEHEIKNYITAKAIGARKVRFLADPESLCSKSKFKSLLMRSTRLLFKGSDAHLDYLIENNMDLTSAPLLRKLTRIGYDAETQAYVYRHIAFDKDGNMFFPNTEGFFEELELVPSHYKHAIKSFGKCSLKEFADDLYTAWGANALITLGYYVATMFSHIIYEDSSFGFFPFLSLYGDKNTGKSTMVNFFNAAFSFIAEEGLALTGANTKKGLSRRMAQRVSMALPLLEGNKGEKFTFDENQLLPLYNRESPQNTAQKTMDLTTRDLPFDATLLFVQNNEPFTLGAVKQRVISLKFKNPENKVFSQESIDAVTRLQKLCNTTRGSTDICGVGIEILKNRKFFEERIVNRIHEVMEQLKKKGITNRRVCANYAIPLAGFKLFAEIFYPEFIEDQALFDNLIDKALPSAINKMETAENESDMGQDFFNAFEKLSEPTGGTISITCLKEGEHYLKEEKTGLLFVRLTEVCRVMDSQGYRWAQASNFKGELRKHERFQGERPKKSKKWVGKKLQRAWVFQI